MVIIGKKETVANFSIWKLLLKGTVAIISIWEQWLLLDNRGLN